MTIGLVYGFSEGPVRSRELEACLAKAGLHIVSPEVADIIVTHSGGCVMIPQQHRAKLIICVAPTLGPATNHLVVTQLKKFRDDIKALGVRGFSKRNTPNAINIIPQMRRNIRMIRRVKLRGRSLPPATHGAIIAYSGDVWSQTVTKEQVMAYPNYTFLTHSGDHDDLWEHPEPYAKLIQTIATQAGL